MTLKQRKGDTFKHGLVVCGGQHGVVQHVWLDAGIAPTRHTDKLLLVETDIVNCAVANTSKINIGKNQEDGDKEEVDSVTFLQCTQ